MAANDGSIKLEFNQARTMATTLDECTKQMDAIFDTVVSTMNRYEMAVKGTPADALAASFRNKSATFKNYVSKLQQLHDYFVSNINSSEELAHKEEKLANELP